MALLWLSLKIVTVLIMNIASSTSATQNLEVSRFIDVSSQIVHVSTHIKVKNTFKDPIDSYMYIVDPQWADHLTHIQVLDDNKNQLLVERVPKYDNSEKSLLQYKIMFQEPLSTDKAIFIVVSLVITNYLQSSPRTVAQNEKHHVLFSFNVYYYSMYFTQVQTTFIYIGTSKVAQIDGAVFKISKDDNYGLQYGPYHGVDSFKNYQTVFHYENNSPFLVVEKINRYIKLSHWGYVSVWDQIQLVNNGPKLKGPYERPGVQNKQSVSRDTRVESFISTLPGNAFDIYLKDEIGLIWSYDVDYDKSNKVEVVVRPRIILYGGWKTQYEIGYSVPISDYVSNGADNTYILSFPSMDSIFKTMVINEAEINIILPEGAEFLFEESYFKMENNTDTKFCYYLDVTCRSVVSFKKKNLVKEHIINLTIAYSFSQYNLLRKPLIITVILICVFILFKIFINPHSEPKKNKEVKTVEPSNNSVSCSSRKKNKKTYKQKQF